MTDTKNVCFEKKSSKSAKLNREHSTRGLQRMYNAAGEDDMERINLRAVNGAVKLVEYFRKTAEKAADIISKTPIHEVGKKEIINGIRTINPDFNKTQLANMLKVERKTIYSNLK